MTSRRSSLLTGLPILVLVPLLAAPRGCHFGSGDVPLGTNPDEELAGAGNGDDGVGAGGSVGGTSGASGSGSGAPSGGSSGASTGGAGGSGGSSPDSACIEKVTPLSDLEETPLGIDAREVEALLAGAHRTPFVSRSSQPTTATLELVGPMELFYVESQRHPDLPPEVGASCDNHVLARTYVRFFTDDGSLDETFPEHEFWVFRLPNDDGDPVLLAYSGAKLFIDELRGTYPLQRFERMEVGCLQGIEFVFEISENEFSGLIHEWVAPDPLADVSCLDNEYVQMLELASFDCQGAACRVAPDDSIVVEAESCDRFGVQLTKSGDEASFSRDGDVLTRDETWGCGCPARPEFVMAYTPTSPLELRLCHEDEADRCEGLCERPVSYDLARAFARARTTEFRFAD
jgi:hypothetical protein